MKWLTVLLVSVTTGLTAGFSPAFLHHLKRQELQQFGKCSLEETQDIFADYPDQCYSSFSSLREAIESGSEDETVYQDIYSQLCSLECTDQVKTFSETCEASEYTEPILHACDSNSDTGDFCLAALHKNGGTQAAINCYSALATGECSETCSGSLEQLKTDLGCCVNTLFNTSTYGLDRLNVASHKLWTMCQVGELPQCDNPLLVQALSAAPGLTASVTLLSLLTFIQTLLFSV